MIDDVRTIDKGHIEEAGEQPRMPGHETELQRKLEWQPRYPGAGRLDHAFTRSLSESVVEDGIRVDGVAPAFLFFADEDSSYMSGQVLHSTAGPSLTAESQRLRIARSPTVR